jgi:hypothetical protein
MRLSDSGWLERNRDRAIAEGIAMATYNPSIGRVLAPGGVRKFRTIAWRASRQLRAIRSHRSFDRWHHRLVLGTLARIGQTARRRRTCYGQAQKPVNVFLKVYVDWAQLPDKGTAARLAGYLHVPLDSVVMGQIRREYPELHKRIVAPAYEEEGEWPSDLRLAIISNEMYAAWQRLFRKVRPRRPIDLDVIWSLARRD